MIHLFIIQLLCAVHSTNYTSLPHDLQPHVVSYFTDSDRSISRRVNTGQKTVVDLIYDKEINEMKSILFDAINLDEKVDKLKTMFSGRTNLFFRQMVDKELPQIFKTMHYSSNQSFSLLHAMNKGIVVVNYNRDIAWFNPRVPSLQKMLETASEMALLHYIHFHENSQARQPFVYIVGAIFYQFMQSNFENFKPTKKTIIWDTNITDMIIKEVSEKDSRTISLETYADWMLWYMWPPSYLPISDMTRSFWQTNFIDSNLMYHTFTTKLIAKLSEIHDDKNNNLEFTILEEHRDHNDEWLTMRQRDWIERVYLTAIYQHNAGDMESFDMLIHSLATIFYSRNLVDEILQLEYKYNTMDSRIVFKKLRSLTRWNWPWKFYLL